MRGRATDYAERWADRKKPVVKPRWGDDHDTFLEEACKTTQSFGQIRDAFNLRFPEHKKTRNAIIGRAQRMGLTDDKPKSNVRFGTNRRGGRRKPVEMKLPRIKGDKPVKVSKQALAPVVFKESLRDDAEPILRRSSPHMMKRRTPEQIANARKGHLPCIIEERPLTSVGIDHTEADSCKWPTSDDVRCLEVCGEPAEIGAYCKRHAMVAYREMPTKRRNAGYSRRGMIDDETRIKERDARMIDEMVLDDAESPAMSDEVAGLLEDFTKDKAL